MTARATDFKLHINDSVSYLFICVQKCEIRHLVSWNDSGESVFIGSFNKHQGNSSRTGRSSPLRESSPPVTCRPRRAPGPGPGPGGLQAQGGHSSRRRGCLRRRRASFAERGADALGPFSLPCPLSQLPGRAPPAPEGCLSLSFWGAFSGASEPGGGAELPVVNAPGSGLPGMGRWEPRERRPSPHLKGTLQRSTLWFSAVPALPPAASPH